MAPINSKVAAPLFFSYKLKWGTTFKVYFAFLSPVGEVFWAPISVLYNSRVYWPQDCHGYESPPAGLLSFCCLYRDPTMSSFLTCVV